MSELTQAIIVRAVQSGDLIHKSDAGGDDPTVQTPQPGEVPASSAPVLIPKADAELAVALAYKRAGYVARKRADALREFKPEGWGPLGGIVGVAVDIEAAILSLAPVDALAEVARMRAEMDALMTALIWCSGSDDFQVDGKAREGWLKLCAPLLQRATLKGDTP